MFYEFFPDTDESSWHLDLFVDADGVPVEERLFISSQRVAVKGPLRCSISHDGRATDFTYGPFFVPISIRALSQQIAALAPHDIQLIPLVVDGSTDAFDIINVLPLLNALDENRTVGGRWPEGTASANKWLYVVHAALDPGAVKDHSIFRVPGPFAAPFCDERVRQALEPQEWTGLVLRPTLPAV